MTGLALFLRRVGCKREGERVRGSPEGFGWEGWKGMCYAGAIMAFNGASKKRDKNRRGWNFGEYRGLGKADEF